MITYGAADVALDDADGRWSVQSATEIGPGLSTRISATPLPGMDGELATDYEPLDAPTLLIRMRVNGVSDADLMANYRGLLSVLSPTGDLTVTKTVDDVTYQTTARGKSTTAPEYQPAKAAPFLFFNATLRLTGVYWRGDLATWSQAAPSSGVAYTVSTLDGSTAPVDDALILITGPAQSPSIHCLGRQANLNLTLAGGEKALINCATWSVRYGTDVTFGGGGVSKARSLGNDGGPYALRLIPRIQSGDPTDMRVQVAITATAMTSATKLQIRVRPAYSV